MVAVPLVLSFLLTGCGSKPVGCWDPSDKTVASTPSAVSNLDCARIAALNCGAQKGTLAECGPAALGIVEPKLTFVEGGISSDGPETASMAYSGGGAIGVAIWDKDVGDGAPDVCWYVRHTDEGVTFGQQATGSDGCFGGDAIEQARSMTW